jgi:hypothetical protein
MFDRFWRDIFVLIDPPQREKVQQRIVCPADEVPWDILAVGEQRSSYPLSAFSFQKSADAAHDLTAENTDD